MNLLDDEIKDIIIHIVIIILILLVLGLIIYNEYINKNNECICDNVIEEPITATEDIPNIIEEPKEPTKYKVDIKGAVQKPGVYTVDEGTIIMDVINLSGGLKNNGSTKYLNLSKKVSNEMVINIYTTYEISLMDKPPTNECKSTSEDISNCKNCSIITSTQSESNKNETKEEPVLEPDKKISINNGTKEDLMKLSGIGESKALAIIEYREKNNGFKTIEEIKNVSGIGEAAFEKIKDSIEL